MTFDLKGSTVGRKTKFEEGDSKWWLEVTLGHKKVMKDLNLKKINSDWNRTLINFDYRDIQELNEITQQDSEFLKE